MPMLRVARRGGAWQGGESTVNRVDLCLFAATQFSGGCTPFDDRSVTT